MGLFGNLFTITPDGIKTGWTPTEFHQCPVLSLGTFPSNRIIYFPKHQQCETVVYTGNFVISKATEKANLFPPKYGPTSNILPAIAIIKIPDGCQRQVELTLPFYVEENCPEQNNYLSGMTSNNVCPHCHSSLEIGDVWRPGSYHPQRGEVVRYYPLQNSVGPLCYGMGEGPETTDYLVSFVPGECIRISTANKQEEFVLYGKDGQWHRDAQFDAIQDTGKYDMSHVFSYLATLDESAIDQMLRSTKAVPLGDTANAIRTA